MITSHFMCVIKQPSYDENIEAAIGVVHSVCTLLKRKLWHICFPMNFAKFLRTLFLQNTSGQLLLKISCSREKTKKNLGKKCYMTKLLLRPLLLKPVLSSGLPLLITYTSAQIGPYALIFVS